MNSRDSCQLDFLSTELTFSTAMNTIKIISENINYLLKKYIFIGKYIFFFRQNSNHQSIFDFYTRHNSSNSTLCVTIVPVNKIDLTLEQLQNHMRKIFLIKNETLFYNKFCKKTNFV